jgi:sugar-specific transcriptional regulator TrmB/DNA-binding CsgD family transcriptional regulator
MLDSLGVSTLEERLYRELLRQPHAPLAELAAASGISIGQARRAVAGLSRAGLVSRRHGTSNRLIPAPPDVAIEALIARRSEELGRARLAAAGLLTEYQQGARRDNAAALIEVITGRAAIYQRSVQLLHSARQEILMFDKPPYIGPLDNAIEFELLARGIRWRSVYAPEALHSPDRVAQMRALQRAGERARIAPDLPLKLAIADNRLALLPLTTNEDEQEMAILVHPCSLLTTVRTLFDLFWERGMPAAGEVNQPSATWRPSQPDRTLLLLLTAGATDEAIARQLGVSVRTARRRLADLMHANGVQTRFQLGLVAGRHGWA